MKRPSFQFYPADWQGNSNLRRCTHEEKGVWMDVLCLLHDQEEYGIARWPLKEIAQAIGCTTSKLQSLVAKKVLKGADVGKECDPLIYTPRTGRKTGAPVTLIERQPGPIWFSSRMVEDEHKRVLRGEYGVSPKATPNHSPKGGIGEGIGDTPKATPNPSPDLHLTLHPSRARPSSSSSSSSTASPLEPSTPHTVSDPERPPRDSTAESAPVIPVSPAGAICLAIREEGVPTANPSHPTLIALIEAGADPNEFRHAAREAVAKGKPDFAYVVGTVRRRREEAAALVLHKGRMPNKQEALEEANRTATAGWKPPELREQSA